MKRIFLILFFIFCASVTFCDEVKDVKAFFESYVKSANSYQKNLPSYYSTHAKIIRIVIKPDGTKESIEFQMSGYKTQLIRNSKFAKMVRYKNNYKNIEVTKLNDNLYKISAIRYPNNDKEGLQFYFIVKKMENGYKVIEESMETKRQEFLKYKTQ